MKKKSHWFQLDDGWFYVEDTMYVKSTDAWQCHVRVHDMGDRQLFTTTVSHEYRKYAALTAEQMSLCDRVVLQKDYETLAAALMAAQEWMDNN